MRCWSARVHPADHLRAADRRRYERELIDARKQSDELQSALEERLRQERENAELREQFIAVLGHDLRNPLASIAAGARLDAQGKDAGGRGTLEAMMQSSVGRMAKMIESVMDLARGRLGGGISLSKAITAIEPVLDQVVAELAAAHPERGVETHFELETPIFCDPARVGQLFSNLLGNAISHGAPDKPVRVDATAKDGRIRTLRGQLRGAHSGGCAEAAVSAVLPRSCTRSVSRARPWPLHRRRDRKGPRRHDRG